MTLESTISVYRSLPSRVADKLAASELGSKEGRRLIRTGHDLHLQVGKHHRYIGHCQSMTANLFKEARSETV